MYWDWFQRLKVFGFLLLLHQVCPGSCTFFLLISIRHCVGGRGLANSCIRFCQHDGVAPGLSSDSRLRREEISELLTAVWRGKAPAVKCPQTFFPAETPAPHREQGCLPSGAGVAPHSGTLLSVTGVWQPDSQGWRLCPLWEPPPLLNLWGEGKTHHINNLMHLLVLFLVLFTTQNG